MWRFEYSFGKHIVNHNICSYTISTFDRCHRWSQIIPLHPGSGRLCAYRVYLTGFVVALAAMIMSTAAVACDRVNLSVIIRTASCQWWKTALAPTLTSVTWNRFLTIYCDWKYSTKNSTMRRFRKHQPIRYRAIFHSLSAVLYSCQLHAIEMCIGFIEIISELYLTNVDHQTLYGFGLHVQVSLNVCVNLLDIWSRARKPVFVEILEVKTIRVSNGLGIFDMWQFHVYCLFRLDFMNCSLVR